jgi:hypothetical protein
MRRAKARVELEEDQYEQQKLQAGISMGATLLGAIFGRGSLGRATTTARGAGRVAREREDVARARQALEELRQEQRDLEIEIEEELRVYQAEQDAQLHEIEELIIRPRKSDIEVSDLKLVWMQR